MGCGSSAPKVVVPVAPSASVSDVVDFKPIHSAIRWNKPVAEVELLLAAGAAAVNCRDTNNGNYPVHIAAQNGHVEILKLLVRTSFLEMNATNGKGNTGIHMAVGYDYYDCAQVLIDAGADRKLNNEAGFPGDRGIEGDKTIGISALMTAETPSAVTAAFALCQTELEDLRFAKSNFASAGMKAKKALGADWAAEHQATLKSIIQSIS